MRVLRTFVCVLVVVGALGSPSWGQLYTETFDDLNASSRWTVNTSGIGINLDSGSEVPLDTNFDPDGDGVVDDLTGFAFDYSTIGVPAAPNSGGTTVGMKLQANLFSDAFGGFSVSPNSQAFTGDYTLAYDMWSNYPGDLLPGGSGSTNLSYGGIMSSGTFENKPGAADGVWFGYTGDGDSGADYRVYSSDRPVSYQFPPDPEAACGCDEDATYHAGSRDHTAALYFENINPEVEPGSGVGGVEAPAAQLALFPQQTGNVRAGAPGMAWRRHEITKIGDLVTWEVDGILLISLDTANFTEPVGGENILFGHSDINGSSSLDPNSDSLLMTIVDNIVVSAAVPSDDADFDGDTLVAGNDFAIWQRNFEISDGTALQGDGDANGDGNVNAADLASWARQLGSSAASASVGAVPEPTGAWLLAVAAALATLAVHPRRKLAIQPLVRHN